MSGRFFGYGSLVNTATHLYGQVDRATVPGWRRVWVQSTARQVAFLSVVPDTTCEIAGVTASIGDAGWEALDIREAAYDRLTLPDPHDGVAMYRAAPRFVGDPSLGQPILLSYLDVVVQGYLHEFGEDGVAQFFDTTDGWDAPLLNDRSNPIYARAQEVSRSEIALTDHHLARVQRF